MKAVIAGCLFAGMAACASVPDMAGPPPLERRAEMATAVQAEPNLTAQDILRRAHEAAGGDTWRKPGELFLEGYNIIRTADGGEVVWDRYAMWRGFSDAKDAAHQVEGKVRIEAWSGDRLAMLVTFDGEATYNQDGRVADQSANAMWGANFGYGAIRNALDEGWSQKRLPDDLMDGEPAFMVELTDPSGGMTRFGIRQSDYAIVYVGFDTPRGWHERRYSHFFSKPGVSWVQPGRVRLYYDGVKANEAIWTDFDLTGGFDDALFRVEAAPTQPSW